MVPVSYKPNYCKRKKHVLKDFIKTYTQKSFSESHPILGYFFATPPPLCIKYCSERRRKNIPVPNNFLHVSWYKFGTFDMKLLPPEISCHSLALTVGGTRRRTMDLSFVELREAFLCFNHEFNSSSSCHCSALTSFLLGWKTSREIKLPARQ